MNARVNIAKNEAQRSFLDIYAHSHYFIIER